MVRCSIKVDAKPFTVFVRKLTRLMKRAPKLPLDLRRRIRHTLVEVPKKSFALESKAATRTGLRIVVKPSKRALEIAAAIRAL